MIFMQNHQPTNTVQLQYFDLVPDGDYLSLLKQNSADSTRFFEDIPAEKLDYRYAAR